MKDEQRRELLAQHKALAESAHERGDIPEANYQYGWVDALAADLADNQSQSECDVVARIREAYEFYLLDSDPSRGEIFAQQVGQILDAQPQENT